MRLDDRSFLERRARDERRCVARSTHHAQRRAHLEMARAYEARLGLLDRFSGALGRGDDEPGLPRLRPDQLRIVPEDEQDIIYWCRRLGVSRTELLRAIRIAGTRIDMLMGALQSH